MYVFNIFIAIFIVNIDKKTVTTFLFLRYFSAAVAWKNVVSAVRSLVTTF